VPGHECAVLLFAHERTCGMYRVVRLQFLSSSNIVKLRVVMFTAVDVLSFNYVLNVQCDVVTHTQLMALISAMLCSVLCVFVLLLQIKQC